MSVSEALVYATDLVSVTFTESMKNDAALQNPDNYIITADTGGVPVSISRVLTGTEVGATEVFLEVTPPSIDGQYTIAVDTTGLIQTLRDTDVPVGFESASFFGRKTKTDRLITGLPRLYTTRPGTTLRSVIGAIGRQDDLIAGNRDDRLSPNPLPGITTEPAFSDSGIAVSEPAQTDSAIVGLLGGAASSGQVLVAVLGMAEADVSVVPTGWTLQGTDSFVHDGDTNIMRVYTKVAGGSEPATYTWTLNGVGSWLAIISSYNTANATQPEIAPQFTICNSSNVNNCPSADISPVNTNSKLIVAHLLRRSVTAGTVFTVDPTGMTKREDDPSENNAGGFMRLGYWDQDLPVAGPTGTRTATTSSNLRWLTMIMALRGS